MSMEQFQQFMQQMIPVIQNQLQQQAHIQIPVPGEGTPEARRATIHPQCYSRSDKFEGGEEKWREWSYDFRLATATQNSMVFEISSEVRPEDMSHSLFSQTTRNSDLCALYFKMPSGRPELHWGICPKTN